jgi:hypothetical protein
MSFWRRLSDTMSGVIDVVVEKAVGMVRSLPDVPRELSTASGGLRPVHGTLAGDDRPLSVALTFGASN